MCRPRFTTVADQLEPAEHLANSEEAEQLGRDDGHDAQFLAAQGAQPVEHAHGVQRVARRRGGSRQGAARVRGVVY